MADRSDEDPFSHVQRPSDFGSDTLFDLMYDANRRLWALYVPQLESDPNAMETIRAIRDEVDSVPLDDVAAWKRARDDFNARWKALRSTFGVPESKTAVTPNAIAAGGGSTNPPDPAAPESPALEWPSLEPGRYPHDS